MTGRCERIIFKEGDSYNRAVASMNVRCGRLAGAPNRFGVYLCSHCHSRMVAFEREAKSRLDFMRRMGSKPEYVVCGSRNRKPHLKLLLPL